MRVRVYGFDSIFAIPKSRILTKSRADAAPAVVSGDPRLRTKAYGRVFLDALPPSPVMSDGAAGARFLTERLGALRPAPVRAAKAT